MASDLELIRGTFDLILLKTLSWGPQHGLGVLRWIEQTTVQRLQIEEARSIPRCTVSSRRSGSRPSGDTRRTTVARNTIASRRWVGSNSWPKCRDGPDTLRRSG